MGLVGPVAWLGAMLMLGGQCCRKRKAETGETAAGPWAGKGLGMAAVVVARPVEPGEEATQLSTAASEGLDGTVELDVEGEPSTQDTLLSTGLPPTKRHRPRPTTRIRFSKRGRQKVVPFERHEIWEVRKERHRDSSAGRVHVVRTLAKKGGHLINWAERGTDGGPTYRYVPPNSTIIMDDYAETTTDAEIPVTDGHSLMSASVRSLPNMHMEPPPKRPARFPLPPSPAPAPPDDQPTCFSQSSKDDPTFIDD